MTDYIYLTDYSAYQNLLSAGYTDGGTLGYVHATSQSGDTPLYRFYNSAGGWHFFTTAFSEGSGLTYEFIACYVWGGSGPSVIDRWHHTPSGAYRFTVHETFQNDNSDWVSEGGKFVISPSSGVALYCAHTGA